MRGHNIVATQHEVIEVHKKTTIMTCALVASFALSSEAGAQQPPPFMSSNQQVFMTEVVSDGNQGNGEYACESNTTDCVRTSVHRIPPGFDNFAVFLSSFNVGTEAGYIPVQTLSARIFNDTYNPATGDVTWSSEVIFQESTSTTATITFNVHATILAWNGSGIAVSPISEICTGADSASVCSGTFIGSQTAWVPPGQQFITAAPKRLSFRTTTGAAIEMTGLGYGFDGPLTPNGTNYELDYDCRFNGETSPGNIVSTECELGGLIISAEPNMLVSS